MQQNIGRYCLIPTEGRLYADTSKAESSGLLQHNWVESQLYGQTFHAAA